MEEYGNKTSLIRIIRKNYWFELFNNYLYTLKINNRILGRLGRGEITSFKPDQVKNTIFIENLYKTSVSNRLVIECNHEIIDLEIAYTKQFIINKFTLYFTFIITLLGLFSDFILIYIGGLLLIGSLIFTIITVYTPGHIFVIKESNKI